MGQTWRTIPQAQQLFTGGFRYRFSLLFGQLPRLFQQHQSLPFFNRQQRHGKGGEVGEGAGGERCLPNGNGFGQCLLLLGEVAGQLRLSALQCGEGLADAGDFFAAAGEGVA